MRRSTHKHPFSSKTPALGLAPPNEVPDWIRCAIHFFSGNTSFSSGIRKASENIISRFGILHAGVVVDIL